ncbi:MAG TPA: NAD(P)/FAD-dependent oxidoreductase [Eubacteriaceae bacterium]|nr:NAD(P)/FAD-dependent oxidoreductase [Eubacteriaceae bacterium]
MKKYDLVVVGTGTGGSAPAYAARKAGLSVAIIDKREYGGTCALRGCDPKKVLVGAAEIMDRIQKMKGLGIKQGSSIQWEDLMDFKRTFTKGVSENREEGYRSAGIDTYHGVASFQSENEILVGDALISFEQILLATGAKPRPLNLQGEEYIDTSDDFLELDHLPKKLVFIGGGFISFEFAHIAAFGGSEVHILQRSEKPLKKFDSDLVSLLVKRSRELGIQVHLNTKPTRIEKMDGKYKVFADQKGESVVFECDRVFHGAGRIPDTDDLNLEAGGVREQKKGIAVNEFLQSISNERVYAAGDSAASMGLPLTPVGGKESAEVIENILKGNHRQVDYSVMPSVVFTQPKLAKLGLTEEEALDQGIEIDGNKMDLKDWYTYKRTNEPYAMIKTVTEKKTGKLIGVHLLGSNADELINYFALIMKFDLPYEEVKKTIFAYPATASDLEYLL